MPEENPRRRRSHLSSLIAFIVVLALGFGCYYAWKIFSSGIEPIPEQPATPVQETPPPVADTSATYASSTMGITVKYPREFTLAEDYAYTGVSADKPISGVKFTIPEAMATGTNLSADSYISIEQLPRATSCVGDIYLAANVKAVSVTEGATEYKVASSTEGAAGNRYEETVYAIASSSPCTAVRYFIHSTVLENYGTSTNIQAFDKDALIAAFDKIRQSLVLSAQ